jgi:hypothetical protein
MFFQLQDLFPKTARQGNDRGNRNESRGDVQHGIEAARRRIHRNVEPLEKGGCHRRIIENPPPIGQLRGG